MKNGILRITILLILLLALCGCELQEVSDSNISETTEIAVNSEDINIVEDDTEIATDSSTEAISDTTIKMDSEEVTSDNGLNAGEGVSSGSMATLSSGLSKKYSVADMPAYSDSPYCIINDNKPMFSEEELIDEPFEYYSELDSLGRCGVAYANICKDIMPTVERGEIGQIKPSGWHTVKYNDRIDGNYLYNRCHLIAYQLAGENANEKNLITGTRYLNVKGMLPFENMVADYVGTTDNHVLYRVSPIYDGDNLVVSGVIMEAESVEDKGAGISFCVYVYNVQPGVIIDYANGESKADPDYLVPSDMVDNDVEPSDNNNTNNSQEDTDNNADYSSEESTTEANPEITYIVNTNTGKFHYPHCSSVKQMADKNKWERTDTRDDIIADGYVPCKNCNP